MNLSNSANSVNLHLQPTINIGTLGHVAAGKSSLIKSLTGVATMKHSTELPRGITIKLGYANMKIWKCPKCPSPSCYASTSSDILTAECKHCSREQTLVRHVSFVDCPGHEVLMATMLNGVAVMDGAILVIAGNEECPQPQTTEHLISAGIMGLQHMICVQTKIDLIPELEAQRQFLRIKNFVDGTCANKCPVIPICSQHGLNLDVVLEYIVNKIPTPIRDVTQAPRMMVIRSFNVNKPGADITELQGGVVGGSLQYGKIKLGETLELRPGVVIRDGNNTKCYPLRFKIVSLASEKNPLQEAVPGGLIAVGTDLDPSLTKDDRMVGNILGAYGHTPSIFRNIKIEYNLMKRICSENSNQKVPKPAVGERLRLNVNSMTTHAIITGIVEKCLSLSLDIPVCLEIGDSIALSRSFEKKWRLIGVGKFQEGTPEPVYSFHKSD